MTGYVLLTCENDEKGAPYVEAIKAGGIAGERIRVLDPAHAESSDAAAIAAGADGVVLAGGPDLEPWRYGEKPLADAHLSLWPEHDALELAALAGAREARAPVWGVCRGLQVINVFLGGTLWQDLHLQLPGATAHDLTYPRDALIHPVTVTAADNSLGELLGREAALVNSRHHQAVREPAPELTVVGVSPDGVVEAACLEDDDWWVQAVQWHPENLVALDFQLALWRQFAAVVDKRRAAAASGDADDRS